MEELIAGPSEAGIAESRSAVTQAQIQLTAATTLADELLEALTEAFDSYCDRYSGLSASDAVIGDTCAAELLLSDAQVDAIRDSLEDRSSTYETFGTSLIDANIAFVASDADRESAISGLETAEESLADLLQSIMEDDLYQAEQAVDAARASHIAAVAKLEDLRAIPGEEDVYQAEQAVEAARASHTAAVAKLEDLRSATDEGTSSRLVPRLRVPRRDWPAPRPSTTSWCRGLPRTKSSSRSRNCAWSNFQLRTPLTSGL